ncbi:hypothetical protein ALC60_09757 [Trachymyrmex zeteki]|uniref:Uncharacterized protein n=1 Tax=Mycetomoellerius zeteki TaxID=64791 RepID=A0A151WT97_9HYME|nr:hypothetical protein ALC60_09757 [Trachymyrmex zeteki]
MSNCQIEACRSNYRNKDCRTRTIHFHRFPRKNAFLLQWEKACGKKYVNIKNGRICSIHFDSTAYKVYDLDHQPKKRRLKSDAVPTLNLGPSISKEAMNTTLFEEQMEAMNTTLSEEQMEASTSRHSLNFSEQITAHNNHINSHTLESSMSGELLENFLDKSNDPPMEIDKKGLVEFRLQNNTLRKQHVNDNKKEYEIEESVMERERQNEEERDETSEHHLYEEDQDADNESEQNVNTKDRFKLDSGKIKIHECNQCGRTFLLHQMLVLHIQRVHRHCQYECDNCEKRFFDKCDMVKYKSIHLDKMPFSCSTCQNKFRLMDQLRKHEKIHTNEMHYACQHCSRRFVTIEECKKHENSEHKKVKQFQCDICGNCFVYKQSLQRHITLHESNLFTCNYCTEAFDTKSLLNQHLFTHIDNRPHACKVCLKTFSRLHHLIEHLQVNHSGLDETENYYSDTQSEAQQLTVSSPPVHSPKYKIIFSISNTIPI